MAPQVLSDVFVPALPDASAGRRGGCWYGAEGADAPRAGAVIHQGAEGKTGALTIYSSIARALHLSKVLHPYFLWDFFKV